VATGDVGVLERDDRPVGFLHADRTLPDLIQVAGVGILPEMQGRGLGTFLVERCLSLVDPTTRNTVPILTITSPRNLRMLAILLSHGFVARWYLQDHFGPKRDRLGMQLARMPVEPGEGDHVLPVEELGSCRYLLAGEGLAVTSLCRSPGGPIFLVRHCADDCFPPVTASTGCPGCCPRRRPP